MGSLSSSLCEKTGLPANRHGWPNHAYSEQPFVHVHFFKANSAPASLFLIPFSPFQMPYHLSANWNGVQICHWIKSVLTTLIPGFSCLWNTPTAFWRKQTYFETCNLIILAADTGTRGNIPGAIIRIYCICSGEPTVNLKWMLFPKRMLYFGRRWWPITPSFFRRLNIDFKKWGPLCSTTEGESSMLKQGMGGSKWKSNEAKRKKKPWG